MVYNVQHWADTRSIERISCSLKRLNIKISRIIGYGNKSYLQGVVLSSGRSYGHVGRNTI